MLCPCSKSAMSATSLSLSLLLDRRNMPPNLPDLSGVAVLVMTSALSSGVCGLLLTTAVLRGGVVEAFLPEYAFEFACSGVGSWADSSIVDIGCCTHTCVNRCWFPVVDGIVRIVMYISNAVYSSALVFSSFCCFCFGEDTRRRWRRWLLLLRFSLLAFTAFLLYAAAGALKCRLILRRRLLLVL